MGCDIHIFTEVKTNGKWQKVNSILFDYRNYAMFAFFAGVRNEYECTPILRPKGLPTDSEYLNSEGYNSSSFSTDVVTQRENIMEDGHYHSYSFLTAQELNNFDYEQTFISKREHTNDFEKEITYRYNLGPLYFENLAKLNTLGQPNNARIVFYFDN